MSRLLQMGRVLGAAIFMALPVSIWAAVPGVTLSPDQIVAKTLARAEAHRSGDSQPNYLYTKHTITEDLDHKGHVKERKEKLYQVSVESGLSYLKLLQLNGQNLSAVELKKQEEREAAERQRMTDSKPGQKGDQREDFLTAELVSKYNFTMVEQKEINGRNTYVLSFEPKSGLQVKKFTDRFANQIAGTVCIDAEEFEIARAEVHLQGEVALWGGMIGSLKHCRFTLERSRMPDGVWFNSLSHGIFEGRKLLEPMMVRTRSESTNFHRAEVSIQ